MKRIFIAAEFNPFHYGHSYIIAEAKRRFEGAGLVSAMSGSFVQRGGPAIFDKKIRAAVAASCGVDLTVQLPFVYAAQNAETFALGAVKTAKICGCDAICFGVEDERLDMFLQAQELLKNDEVILLIQNRHDTVPYARARIQALNKISGKDFSFLEKPNNILALEYIRAVKNIAPDMTSVAIKRDAHATLQSASMIRESLAGGKIDISQDIKAPCEIYKKVAGKEIYEQRQNSIENYALPLKAALITKPREEIENIADIGEGSVARMIKNAAVLDSGVAAFTAACTAKRLTAARIRRSVINILMNYTKDDAKLFRENSLSYVRVLSLGERGAETIKDIRNENACVKIVSRLAREIGVMNDIDSYCAHFDIVADDLYNLNEGAAGSELKYTPFVLG